MTAERINKVLSNIRKQRQSKGYSQLDIAIRLEATQNAYSKMELGYNKITLNALYQLADIFDTDIFELLNNVSYHPKKIIGEDYN